MTREDRVQVWRSRIETAKDHRREFFRGTGRFADPESEGGVPGADFAFAAFRGDIRPDWWSTQDPYVSINKTKSAIRAALPSLLYSSPKWNITPKGKRAMEAPEDAYARAKAQEAWLEHVWNETDATRHCRIAIQNSFCAYGVAKAGYRVQFQDDNKRGVYARDEETDDLIIGEDGDPELERGEFLIDEDGERIRDEDGIPLLHPGTISKEHWFVETVNPAMMLFDVESGPVFSNHRWVIEEWVRPLSEIRADPRFPRSLRSRVQATETAGGQSLRRRGFVDQNGPRDYGDSDDAVRGDEDRVRGYDIWCFETGRYMVLLEDIATERSARPKAKRRVGKTAPAPAAANETFLLDMASPRGVDRGPYRFLKLTEDMGHEWYPIPDAIDMALVNAEYNITRSQVMIHREHTKTRYLESPGAFESDGADAEEERAKFMHGPDATLVKVNSAMAITAAPKANLDSSFASAIPNIMADFNEVAGMPGESRGVADADTATQASILAVGAETRNSDRRDNLVATFLAEVARMLLISGQANAELDTLVVRRVAERTGALPFRAEKITPEELRGEFDVEVAIGSTQPKNSPQVMNTLMNLLNALAQNPALGLQKGLISRVLDGMAIDPLLADEIAMIAEQQMQAQMQGPAQGTPEAGPADVGQTLMGMLGGTANAAGGAQTGAQSNGMF